MKLETRVSLFFPAKEEKNTACVYLFPRKSLLIIHSDFKKPFFFIKSRLCFFIQILCVFVSFLFQEKVHMSFIQFNFCGRKKNKKQPGNKKKTPFLFIHSIFLKKVKKMYLFWGYKNNTIPLAQHIFLKRSNILLDLSRATEGVRTLFFCCSICFLFLLNYYSGSFFFFLLSDNCYK